MFFVTRPQSHFQPARRPTSAAYDDEDAYVEFKRREYMHAVEQQRKRQELEEAIALENARHRAQLEALAAEQEQQRRRFLANKRASVYGSRPASYPRPNAIPDCEGACGKRVSFVPQVATRREQPQGLEHLFGPRLERKPAVRSKPVEPQAVPQEDTEVQDVFANLLRQIFEAPDAPVSQPKAAPVPKAQPTPAVPTQEARSADASSEGAHWSDAPKRAAAMGVLSNISHQFDTLRRTFVFPENAHLERLTSSDEPRLAFSPVNAPILAYEHALSELLTKLDAVESHGFKGVRDARKDLVIRVEKELDELERKVSEAIGATASPANKPSEVSDVVSIPVVSESDVELFEEKEVQDEVMEVEQSVQGYDLESVVPTEAVQTEENPLVEASKAVVQEDSAIEVDEPVQEESAPAPFAPSPAVDLSESILFDQTPVLEPSTVSHPNAEPLSDSLPTSEATPIVTEPAVLEASTISSDDSASETEEDDTDTIHVSVTLDGKVHVDAASEGEESPSDREFEML